MIVADSTPLIAFARIGRLELLERIVGHLIVPQAVFDEVAGAQTRPGSLEIPSARWLEVRAVESVPAELVRLIDHGECEVIALAEQIAAEEVLIDERAARAVASARGLVVVGTAGLLVRAKVGGLLDAVAPVLEAMRSNGIRYSDRFVAELLRGIGE